MAGRKKKEKKKKARAVEEGAGLPGGVRVSGRRCGAAGRGRRPAPTDGTDRPGASRMWADGRWMEKKKVAREEAKG